jgi:hypothetical protein
MISFTSVRHEQTGRLPNRSGLPISDSRANIVVQFVVGAVQSDHQTRGQSTGRSSAISLLPGGPAAGAGPVRAAMPWGVSGRPAFIRVLEGQEERMVATDRIARRGELPGRWARSTGLSADHAE